MPLIVVFWLSGFLLAVAIVLPFVMIRHVRSFADTASADIRGS